MRGGDAGGLPPGPGLSVVGARSPAGRHPRTASYFRQIRGSVLFKILAIAASFIVVPLAIGYAGQARFGVWVTMYSILSWIVFFDLGLGNGLRNRVAAALAAEDRAAAARLIGTGYASVAAIALGAYALLFAASQAISWQAVFNTTSITESELRTSVIVVGLLICLNFVFALVNQLLHATQQTSVTVFSQMLFNVLALVLLFGADRWLAPSLLGLASAYALALFGASMIITIFFFSRRPDLIPSFRNFRLADVRSLTSLGAQFFIIQIAVLVLFTTDKIIIAQLLGPESVAGYEVVLKLFSVILVGSSIMLAPLWSSYTNALAQEDTNWVVAVVRRSNLIVPVAALACIPLVLFGPRIVDLWIGAEMAIPAGLFLTMAVFVVVRTWCDLYAHFLNGAGAIRVQMYIAVIQAVINIPLSIYLGSLFGVSGVLTASIVSLSLSAVGLPLHTRAYLRARLQPA